MRKAEQVFRLPKRLDRDTIPEIAGELLRNPGRTTSINAESVIQIDSAGAALLDEAVAYHKLPRSAVIRLEGDLQQRWELYSSQDMPEKTRDDHASMVETIGGRFYTIVDASLHFFVHFADVAFAATHSIFSRKSARKGSFGEELLHLGLNAAPIVLFLSLILGLILSLQSAAQLRMIGANLFMADLLAISVVREIAPMGIAIIIAGRSGSSIAAELASMSIHEELDALTTMGVDPIRYLTVPKIYAITIAMPLLVTVSIIVAIIAGMGIAVLYLDLSASIFLNRSFAVLTTRDLVMCYSKSLVFGWTIIVIGSFCGFSAKGGAQEVGRMTTTSVVSSIFAVILIDVIFSFVYLG
ncbi:ABC transporter permease [Spirochaeta dissipatitropha]